MRCSTFCVLAALTLAGLTTSRAADLDYDVLRGPDDTAYAPPVDWSGVYLGGHGGYSSANFDASRAVQPLFAKVLAHTIDEKEFGLSGWTTPPAVRAQTGSYGGFAGYNFQFDEAVIGIEGDYTHSVLRGGSTDYISRSYTTSDGYFNTATLAGTTHTSLTDYGTIRVRAGYAIGSFLPFVTGGVAIGRAEVSDVAAISAVGYDKVTADANARDGTTLYVNKTSLTDKVVKSGERYAFGFTAGGGIDYAVTQNIIVRAEYQYVQFNDFDAHKINVNTVRAGAAIKF